MTDNRWCFLFAALVAVLGAVPAGSGPAAAQAEDFSSGNFMLPYCKAAVAGSIAPSNTYFRGGVCYGEVSALMYLAQSLHPKLTFCPPSGVTGKQAVQVVVRDLEAHPEDLHQDFVTLALAALHQAWPCR